MFRLCLVVGYGSILNQAYRERGIKRGLKPFMCGWSLGRIEIDFDQNVPGRTRGSRTAGTGDQIQDSRERIFRKDFKTLHDIPDHAFCKTKKGKGGFGRFHADPADGPLGNGGEKTQKTEVNTYELQVIMR